MFGYNLRVGIKMKNVNRKKSGKTLWVRRGCIDRCKGDVLMDREGFCEKIWQIKLAGNKTDFKLSLFDSIFNPIETHVHAF